MKNKIILAILLVITSSLNFAATNYKKEFTVHFDTGNTYEVAIRNDSLTWKGIAGEDKGTTRTVEIKRLPLANNLEVFQWKEPRGYFVTFILDALHNKGITSTRAQNNQDWLVLGKITDLK